MILNRNGATFTYDGNTYTVGDRVVATEESAYEGLFGTILEIRTGKDKSTDNDTPDFHCAFLPPAIPAEVVALESRFSALYKQKKFYAKQHKLFYANLHSHIDNSKISCRILVSEYKRRTTIWT